MMATGALELVRLLQLASPTLPVGAYSYSQGLESAIEEGIVCDAAGAESWIGDMLRFNMGSFEAPLLWRMALALENDDFASYLLWNSRFLAGREAAELRSETLQMGRALAVLIGTPPFGDGDDRRKLDGVAKLTFPAAFSFAAHRMGIARDAMLLAYLWSWLENQVMTALKAVPLGQTAGQRMLAALGSQLPTVASRAGELAEDELSNFVPGMAIASCRHETQYSRLFRS